MEDGSSGILEHMEIHAEEQLKHPDNRAAKPFAIDPVILTLAHVQGTEAWKVYDQTGKIPTSEEFWTIVDRLARFYHLVDDASIEGQNRRVEAERNGTVTPLRPSVAGGARPDEGYIYLLRSGDHHKIGKSKNPYKRSEQLKIQMPMEAVLLGAWPTNLMSIHEKALHNHFARDRLNGEWFAFNDSEDHVISEISRLVGANNEVEESA